MFFIRRLFAKKIELNSGYLIQIKCLLKILDPNFGAI